MSLWTFLFKYRNVLAALPLIYALLSLRWEYEVNYVLWPLAGLTALLGAALRAWARCHCNYGVTDQKRLTTTGPYALVRNPLYVGNLLVIAGAAVASELLWFVPLALLWAFFIYCGVIRHEESRLEAKYGDDFRQYRIRVHAWWPRSFRIPELAAKGGFAAAFLVQAVYAGLLLTPFIVKELNPFGAWPQP
jgi:protein-S-isoprenylcysteine O-methyltransferase Ste14